MTTPFLSIITRNHPGRDDLFERCKASIEKQKDKDFEHIILYDEEGRGIPYANQMFFNNKHLVTGKYVFMLDSDDILITDAFVGDIKRVADEHKNPGIIFIRMVIEGELYPRARVWKGDTLFIGEIGTSCFVMLNELWQKDIEHFEPQRMGDFNFINTVFSKKPSMHWQDNIYSISLREWGKAICPITEQTASSLTDDVITGVVVVYNSLDLIKRSYDSIRLHHPKMQIIIVDGSDRKDPCYQYIASLICPYTVSIQLNHNIGHGKGLALGLSRVKTPYALIFDSDIEMIKSPVQSMLDMMEGDTLGVGAVEKTDLEGFDFETSARADQAKHGSMRYLHPFFCLIQMKEYRKYSPYIHHGAPAVNLCLDIHNKGLSDKVIKQFPGLGHTVGAGHSWSSVPIKYIRHDIAGTRSLRKSLGLVGIERGWEKVISQGIVTCLTPTGDRLEAFELCRKWMASQTLQPNQWLVVDDGTVPLPKELRTGIDYVRREPSKGEKHTLVANLRASLPHIKGDKILIIEDDDWYGPNYVKAMSDFLDKYNLVGGGRARYYNVPAMKYRRQGNVKHISLCQTGFNRSLLPIFERCFPGDPYIDIRFWNSVNEHKHIFFDVADKLHLHCSMKGLKGRRGIGTGHNPNAPYYFVDSGLQQLIKWVGEENAQIYMDHVGHSFETAKSIVVPQKQIPKMSWRDKIANTIQDCSMIKRTEGVHI